MLRQILLIALATAAPVGTIAHPTSTIAARAFSENNAELTQLYEALRREVHRPMSHIADAMAEAEDADHLDEILWELIDDAMVIKAISKMTQHFMALKGATQAKIVAEFAADQPSHPNTIMESIHVAYAEVSQKAQRLVRASVDSDEEFEAMYAQVAETFDVEMKEFFELTFSPFAPQGGRWYAEGITRTIISMMGHAAIDAGMLPRWITPDVLGTLTLKAINQADKGLDMLLDPTHLDDQINKALLKRVNTLAADAAPGTSVPVFTTEDFS